MPTAIRAWMSNAEGIARSGGKSREGREPEGDSGIVTVFAFLFIIVVFLVSLADSFEFQGIGGHDFEISSAFGTRYDLTLVRLLLHQY